MAENEKEKVLKYGDIIIREKMSTKNNNIKDFVRTAFFMIIAFAFGGAGLSVLFNSKGEMTSVVGGFVLIGIAIAVIYKLIQNE